MISVQEDGHWHRLEDGFETVMDILKYNINENNTSGFGRIPSPLGTAHSQLDMNIIFDEIHVVLSMVWKQPQLINSS